MSGKGSRRILPNGRTATVSKDAKVLVDVGKQFVSHPRSMRESSVFQALSWQARKFLDRLEIEHMAHGGQRNGRLSVSYKQFIAHGISENCIAKAIVETTAGGFVEVMSKGGKAVGDFRPTNLYRLTYLPADGVVTHEWFSVKTVEQYWQRFDNLMREWKEANPARTQSPPPKKGDTPPPKQGDAEGNSHPQKGGIKSHPPNTGVSSISTQGRAA